MKLVSIVGARPQFVKLAPVCRAVERFNEAGTTRLEHLIVHTGQHYDPELSEVFFDELEIPRADVNLGIGSGPHGRQTGRMLEAFEEFVLDARPDALIVYGDTNSTIAGALVGSKQNIKVAHIEAGLRSFNRTMPEEINRIATDHVSDVLYAPTPAAMRLLEREGLEQRSVLAGDVNLDALMQNRSAASRRSTALRTLNLKPRSYSLVTVHRSENTDDGRLLGLLDALSGIASEERQFLFPIHPRTARLLPSPIEEFKGAPGVRLIRPVGFLDMLQLVENARMVLTDSGGLQKEAFFLNVPCITLRDETEWVETVEEGANCLAGLHGPNVVAAIGRWEQELARGAPDFSGGVRKTFGDGQAAMKILTHLMTFIDSGLASSRSRTG